MRTDLSAYLLIVPLLGVLAVVEFYPLVYSSYLSLTSRGGDFVGFSNYLQVVTSGTFWNSTAISLLYSAGSTLLALAIGLSLTFLLTQEIRGRGLFEALFIAPLAVPPIVVGVLWSPSAVWDDFNSFIHFVLGFPYINLLSPFIYLPVMIISEAWEWAPLLMLVSLSIVSSVRREVLEAASVHGASSWQVFRRIIVPTVLRSPVMHFVVVLRFIDAMRAFEIPFTWSTWVENQNLIGSPVDTLSLYLYKLMFIPFYNFPAPLISAVGVGLLAVTLIGAATLLRLLRVMGGST